MKDHLLLTRAALPAQCSTAIELVDVGVDWYWQYYVGEDIRGYYIG